VQNTAVEFIQKSHIAALDLSYDSRQLVDRRQVRLPLGQASLIATQLNFFDNAAQLAVLRVDWRSARTGKHGRGANARPPDISQRRRGALAAIYRHIGKNLKVGVGYNFTDFSDDLTDLRYNHKGVFLNLIGTK
jgi:hypothetical protein